MIAIPIATHRKSELLNVTDVVQEALSKAGCKDGSCFLHCPHTTAGLTINEQADPAVAEDMLFFLSKLVPEDHSWTHMEGNSPAHVKASLMGGNLQLAVEGGKLQLGRWQGVFFCEFDGPRERRIWLQITS